MSKSDRSSFIREDRHSSRVMLNGARNSANQSEEEDLLDCPTAQTLRNRDRLHRRRPRRSEEE